jgi:hypothetical protein
VGGSVVASIGRHLEPAETVAATEGSDVAILDARRFRVAGVLDKPCNRPGTVPGASGRFRAQPGAGSGSAARCRPPRARPVTACTLRPGSHRRGWTESRHHAVSGGVRRRPQEPDRLTGPARSGDRHVHLFDLRQLLAPITG